MTRRSVQSRRARAVTEAGQVVLHVVGDTGGVNGVGAQHDLIRPRRRGSGFFESEAAGVVDRELARLSDFVYRPRAHRKLETRKREQFAAAWRFGSENERGHESRYTILAC